jgi:hypothetical protein
VVQEDRSRHTIVNQPLQTYPKEASIQIKTNKTNVKSSPDQTLLLSTAALLG